MKVSSEPGGHRTVINTMLVDVTDISSAVNTISGFVGDSIGHYVCVANVHMSVECARNELFRKYVNAADLIVPDGKPLSLVQKKLGHNKASQVRGEDLTHALCAYSEKNGLRIGLFGSSDSTLCKLKGRLTLLYPNLKIQYSFSPPFIETGTISEDSIIQEINENVDILFVALGCPKQETWMALNVAKSKCVMLGVGAAFDFISGNKKTAPNLVSRLGLEWAYRLVCEPRRLWRRYLYTNTHFIIYLFKTFIWSNKNDK
ncbi:Putative N-acetylmannosaminyltransferase [Serratia fonticola]|uniref:WecB/TagA/CpsF family glycosyltransferase n=1 Tax=Serratia fonticola TaxID=47917 RepID=UPI0021784AA5|nr:WecB/TagA/CpsF family glycosyltransferase [Serratia fonticola]CAI1766463.1 Putative N-acetylmannosaminyltransferase [Serratia fonticola]